CFHEQVIIVGGKRPCVNKGVGNLWRLTHRHRTVLRLTFPFGDTISSRSRRDDADQVVSIADEGANGNSCAVAWPCSARSTSGGLRVSCRRACVAGARQGVSP